MVVDFSYAAWPEKPVLVLRNPDGTPLQTLGFAHNLTADFCFNEISTIEFDVPRHVDGMDVPNYDALVSMREIEVVGVGVFILTKPKTTGNGVHEEKHCTGYSREAEFLRKRITLPETVYQFWNPLHPEESMLGIIMDLMPSWRVGVVSDQLITKWRNLTAADQCLYDFIKNTVQQSYGCVFHFDTTEREVHVLSTDDVINSKAIYLSTQNLIKELEITEDSDQLVTCLDVNGADGVDIRTVNPTGTNKIYNIDYFIQQGMVSSALQAKWKTWMENYNANRLPYYNLVIAYMLSNAELLTEQEKLRSLKNEDLAKLENEWSIMVAYLASLDRTAEEYNETKNAVDQLAMQIEAMKTSTILDQETIIASITNKRDEIYNEMIAVNQLLEFSNVAWGFSDADLLLLDRLFIQNSIQESSFLLTDVASYTDDGVRDKALNTQLTLDTSEICDLVKNVTGENGGTVLYSAQGGTVTIGSDPGTHASAASSAVYEDVVVNGEQQIVSVDTDFEDVTSIKRMPDDDDELLGWTYSRVSHTIRFNHAVNPPAAGILRVRGTAVIPTHLYLTANINRANIELTNLVDETIMANNETSSFVLVQPMTSVTSVTRGPSSVTGWTYNASSHTLSFSSAPSTGQLIVHGVVDDKRLVASINMGMGSITVDGITTEFPSGCISLVSVCNQYSDNATVDPDIDTLFIGTHVTCDVANGSLYFTRNTTEYERYSVEWDLFEYGEQCLRKLAYPTYAFSIGSSNFLCLEDFSQFARELELGKRIYLETNKGVLTPILVKVHREYDNPSALSLDFGSSFSLNDSSFQLADLISESISMGKTIDAGRGRLFAFQDSGASNSVREYMNGALDVAKQTISNSDGQDVTWDNTGLWIRQIKDETTGEYQPEQIALMNKAIVFSDDGFATAKMAIGKIFSSSIHRYEPASNPQAGDGKTYYELDTSSNTYSPYTGTFPLPPGTQLYTCEANAFGIAAPYLIGTMLAGQELIIESTKSDNSIACFKVDGSGASLHNADFTLYNASSAVEHGRIDLGAQFGIVGGMDGIGDNALWSYDGGVKKGVLIKNGASTSYATKISAITAGYKPNANFWVDMFGDVYLKGTIYAEAGEIGGFTISDEMLHAGSGSNYVALNGGTTKYGTYAMWAGAENPANAPWSVTKDGVMVAKRVTITDDQGEVIKDEMPEIFGGRYWDSPGRSNMYINRSDNQSQILLFGPDNINSPIDPGTRLQSADLVLGVIRPQNAPTAFYLGGEWLLSMNSHTASTSATVELGSIFQFAGNKCVFSNWGGYEPTSITPHAGPGSLYFQVLPTSSAASSSASEPEEE